MKLVSLLALALGACLVLAAPAGAASSTTSKTMYYLSLGDSLSVGIQPGPASDPGHQRASVATNQGYSDQLYALAKKVDPNLKLIKAGCSGATSTNFLHGGLGVGGKRCGQRQPLYRSASTATSQMRYAQDFIKDHKGEIAFITVSIGNNDVDTCLKDDAIDLQCVGAGVATIEKNVGTIGKNLRKAAGKNVPIVGSTFYDPFLGLYLRGGPLAAAAEGSVALARNLNEEILIPTWAKNKVRTARIDQAFDTYAPFDQTVQSADLGTVPLAVFNVCSWTWFCAPAPAGPNVHANVTGYKVITDAFWKTLRVAT
jgi:lysophospholipase L1-like esterase